MFLSLFFRRMHKGIRANAYRNGKVQRIDLSAVRDAHGLPQLGKFRRQAAALIAENQRIGRLPLTDSFFQQHGTVQHERIQRVIGILPAGSPQSCRTA